MDGSILYKRNLLYQQLHFKYVLSQYLYSIVWKIKPKGRCRTVRLTIFFLTLYSIDFIIGILLFIYLMYDPSIKKQIGSTLALYTKTTLELSEEYIKWLMGIPWGIKLNDPLSHFLGTHFLYILNLWKLFYSEFVTVYLSLFIDLLRFLLPFGVTLSITALHDFLKFLNLCLICFYIILNRVIILQLSALKSLGRLFTGKKWNILRTRVDSCDYDINQLLIGTIIFTILLFLLPTTGMYTLVFFFLRLAQFSVQFSLRICAVSINRLTVSSITSLHNSFRPQPISRAKMLISGLTPDEYAKRKVILPYKVVNGKWCQLECFSVKEEDITLLWNGREYSIDEARKIVNCMSEKELQYQSNLSGSGVKQSSAAKSVTEHPMMHWFGLLDTNFLN